jgi:thioredoxin-related protein
MKQDVYTDKGINEYLNENFISYMLDASKLMDKI